MEKVQREKPEFLYEKFEFPNEIPTRICYPWLDFTIKHELVHEMLHSMSVLNYYDIDKGIIPIYPRRT
ncbi:hypothetical protein J6V86_00610 [bacterium]|nr:hypothetical protein [bacterium]